jgi:hypothetical protein
MRSYRARKKQLTDVSTSILSYGQYDWNALHIFFGASAPLISKLFPWIMSVYLQPSVCFIASNLKLWNKEYRMQLIRHFPLWNILTREWISSATDLMFLYIEVPVWNIHLGSESPEPCFGCPYSQLTKERIIHEITLRIFSTIYVPIQNSRNILQFDTLRHMSLAALLNKESFNK